MPKPLPALDPVATAQVCCVSLTASPLSPEDAVELSKRLKALADPRAAAAGLAPAGQRVRRAVHL